MRKRSLAREYCLQILYQIDFTKDSGDEAVQSYWERIEEPVDPQIKQFAVELVKGVTDNVHALDKRISQLATNWKLERIAVIDKNVLRIGSYELLFRDDIPPKVSINEAVDLAKKYSGPKAGQFVNGILDKIKIEKEGAKK